MDELKQAERETAPETYALVTSKRKAIETWVRSEVRLSNSTTRKARHSAAGFEAGRSVKLHKAVS